MHQERWDVGLPPSPQVLKPLHLLKGLHLLCRGDLQEIEPPVVGQLTLHKWPLPAV